MTQAKYISSWLAMMLTLSTFIADAQVESGSFNFALKLLLSRSTPTITIPEAEKNFHKYIFLDARELPEFEVSHLKDARFVGSKSFNLEEINTVDKKQPIVVYCSIGKRSEDVTQQLIKAGFINVKNLYGGIFEWVNEGHPVYDSTNHVTTRVHAYNHFWGRWLDKGVKVYN